MYVIFFYFLPTILRFVDLSYLLWEECIDNSVVSNPRFLHMFKKKIHTQKSYILNTYLKSD